MQAISSPSEHSESIRKQCESGATTCGARQLKVCLRFFFWLLISFVLFEQGLLAQTNATHLKKLPSAGKITDNYLKAIGGKKQVAAIKDVNYDWIIELQNFSIGTAHTQRKPPSSERWEMTFGNGQIISATSGSSACAISLDGT